MIDVFAHVLSPKYLKQMLQIAPDALASNPWMQNRLLTNLDARIKTMANDQQEILSMVNLNSEDFVGPKLASQLCQSANLELLAISQKYPEHFPGVVAMVPMNNISTALTIIDEQVAQQDAIVGIQLFTRALGQPITASAFEPIFKRMAEIKKPIWLHPVFDERKADNNLTFSWEYEQTLAMDRIVNADYFDKYPNLKIIVHHAGAMVPYFAERIYHIQGEKRYADFKNFYVDTALLGNPLALELAVDFFGPSHVLFGTDTPLGIQPNGPTQVIVRAITAGRLNKTQQTQILSKNWEKLTQN